MTVTLDLNPEREQGLLTRAGERGVSLAIYLQKIVSKQVRVAAASAAIRGEVPNCRPVTVAW